MICAWSKSPVRYWNLPGRCIANNHKVASQSIFNQVNALGFGESGASIPSDSTVFLLVREPVSRYVSAMRTTRTYPARSDDPHFESQSSLVVPGRTRLYKFPEHLDEFSMHTGLGRLLKINESKGWCPQLTDSDRDMICTVYASDVDLFNSITKAGTKC